MKLTDDELKTLLELEAKATPGPWISCELGPWGGEGFAVVPFKDAAPGTIEWDESFKTGARSITGANAKLLTESRNAIKPLVEEVLELRKELEQNQQNSQQYSRLDTNHYSDQALIQLNDRLFDDIQSLHREIDRLKSNQKLDELDESNTEGK